MRAGTINPETTGGKNAEQALRESEERFRLLVESSHEAIALVARDGRIIFATSSTERLTGYTPEEFADCDGFALLHPDDLPKVRASLASGHRHDVLECRIRVKDGSWRWMEANVRNLLAEPSIGAYVVNFRDVTHRRDTEHALRESEERLARAERFSQIMVAQIGLDGRWLKVPQPLCEVLGWTEAEMLARTLKDVGHPEDAAADWGQYEALFGSEVKFFSADKRWRRKDGETLWFNVSTTLAMDGAGRPAHFLTYLRDITASAQALEKVRLQAEFLDLTEDAIWVTDPDGKILYWNKGAERLYGWEAGVAIGQKAQALLSRSMDLAAKNCFERTLKSGHWSGELPRMTRNQDKVIVHSRWSLMRDKAIAPLSILVVESDITDQKNLEAQFLRAQRMEGVGRLASGIAHDLNNLLAPILMSVPMLRWGLPAEESEKMLATIEASALRGAELVKQLLTYGRGMEGQRSRVEIGRLAADVAKMLRETFPKEIVIASDRRKGLWLVVGDGTQLHQVVLNLCVNARDAMPRGGKLSLSVENVEFGEEDHPPNPEAGPGRYVRLRVEDTGTGIAPEIMDKIFDPFFTTKEEGEGSGLGLSTVAGIVKSHGGFIDLHSELAKGSRFDVYLPAAVAPDESPAESPPARPPKGNGEMILVVDDEAEIRKVMRETLLHHNYRVITAGDGTEAMAVYAQQQQDINVVITDLVMPFLDGVSLARALKKLNPAVKIMASSGIGSAKAQSEKISQLNELGVTTFLRKPYTSDKVLAALHEILAT